MSNGERDVLGIYIPERISRLSDEEILEKINQLQAHRDQVMQELTRKKATEYKPRAKKDKPQDLSKMDADDVYTVLAAQMGISLDEFKRLVASP